MRREAVRVHCVAAPQLDWCLKLGAVVLTGDLNKGAERELQLGGFDSQRHISPLEAALNSSYDPWPTSGVSPL